MRLSAPRSPVRCTGAVAAVGTGGRRCRIRGDGLRHADSSMWSCSSGSGSTCSAVSTAVSTFSTGSASFSRLVGSGLVGRRDQVLREDQPQLVHRRLLNVPQPPGVPGDRLVQHVAGVAAVAEALVADLQRRQLLEPRQALGGRLEVGLGRRRGRRSRAARRRCSRRTRRSWRTGSPARGWWRGRSPSARGSPATITTRSSRWSSMSLTSVFTASAPYWSSARPYASSTNRTPPRAVATTSDVFTAVCPRYPATSSERSTSTRCPLLSSPSAR